MAGIAQLVQHQKLWRATTPSASSAANALSRRSQSVVSGHPRSSIARFSSAAASAARTTGSS
jgi:hypothetical protein